MLKHIEKELDGVFDYQAFLYVQDHLSNCKDINEFGEGMIHTLYPDCLDKNMDKNDPRYGELDFFKQLELCKYAFPLGFHPLFEIE